MQSTNICSLKLVSGLPPLSTHPPSISPQRPKVPQKPCGPWFFAGVTAPLVRQSVGAASAARTYAAEKF